MLSTQFVELTNSCFLESLQVPKTIFNVAMLSITLQRQKSVLVKLSRDVGYDNWPPHRNWTTFKMVLNLMV